MQKLVENCPVCTENEFDGENDKSIRFVFKVVLELLYRLYS